MSLKSLVWHQIQDQVNCRYRVFITKCVYSSNCYTSTVRIKKHLPLTVRSTESYSKKTANERDVNGFRTGEPVFVQLPVPFFQSRCLFLFSNLVQTGVARFKPLHVAPRQSEALSQ